MAKGLPYGFIPLASSNLRGASYDTEAKELTIHFRSGSSYTYKGVPENTFRELMRAGSPGGFFHSNIKDKFSYD